MALFFPSKIGLLHPNRPTAHRSNSTARRAVTSLSTRPTKSDGISSLHRYQTCSRDFTQSTYLKKSPTELAREQNIIRTRAPLGHKYWGYTIYRSTYGDDASWAQLMQFLHANMKKGLESMGAPWLINTLNLRVQEDPIEFDGASTETIRRHFKHWRQHGANKEVDTQSPNRAPILMQSDDAPHGTTTRYRFRLQVDAKSLHSIIDKEKKEVKDRAAFRGHVNFIKAEWRMRPEEEYAYYCEEEGMEDPLDEGEEPVEGCRLYDVGWMKVRPTSLVPYYSMIDDLWEELYRRPPALDWY